VMAARIPLLQLHALEALAARRLGHGMTDDPALRHALEILWQSEANRRPLRRLLRIIAGGGSGRDYVRTHPVNLAWLRRHPRVDAARWLRGIERRAEVAGLGEVTLAVEQEPLEALKLGTYVDTCLSTGGLYAYAAAAAALDANKRVVYARDRGGKVVGRQLLGISEEDELVCFPVYPDEVSPALQELFLAYDLELGAHLGLRLSAERTAQEREARDADERVALLLARSGYDEYPWDLG
jgi:hypothetical protein